MQRRSLVLTTALCTTLVVAAAAAGTADAAPPAPGHYTGTLADGATWIAATPANWNGTLLLFSHGFGPTTAADATSTASANALLAQAYALAGPSYDPTG